MEGGGGGGRKEEADDVDDAGKVAKLVAMEAPREGKKFFFFLSYYYMRSRPLVAPVAPTTASLCERKIGISSLLRLEREPLRKVGYRECNNSWWIAAAAGNNSELFIPLEKVGVGFESGKKIRELSYHVHTVRLLDACVVLLLLLVFMLIPVKKKNGTPTYP